MRTLALLASLLALSAGATACGGADGPPGAAAREGGAVTVRSCGEPVTFETAPERAVVNDNNMVEMLFALGLTDRMVAYGGVGEKRTRLPRFLDDYARLQSLGADYFTLEPLLGVNPDFVFSGYNYGFDEATGLTPETLAQRGIASYVLTESCRRIDDDLGPSSVRDLYTDVRNLGRIFRVPERAERLIAGWQRRIDAVQARLPAGEPRPTVFTYLGGEDQPSTAPGLTIVSDLNRLAGARNAFDDLRKMWGPVAWEEVVERDPDLIVVVDYGQGPDGRQKIEAIRRVPAMRDVRAVRENRFLILPQEAVNPGIRVADGIERMARALYPERFGSR
jgi:iron complex transport system substrate-binding protein